MGGPGSGGQNKIFSQAIAARVTAMLEEGKMYREIAAILGIEVGTIYAWRREYPSFEQSCTRAQENGFDAQAESLNDIAENTPDVQRARLKCDNLRWYLARRAAHKYGDRIDVNVNQTVDIGSALAEAKRRALLTRDSTNIEDAEVVEPKALPASIATDTESVETPQCVEDLDIFK